MALHAFHFRTYAADETEHWELPDALTGATAFGLYFFLEGEATHICSFEANSRVEFLENVFLDSDLSHSDPDAAEDYRQNDPLNLAYECDGQYTQYVGFIDVKAKGRRPYISRRQTFTLDSNDYDLDAETYADQLAKSLRFNVSPQQAHADARRECLREFAYEAAREEFGCNSPWEPPVLSGGRDFEAHKRRKALREAEARERYFGPPGLFAAAGLEAPLVMPRHVHEQMKMEHRVKMLRQQTGL